MRIKRLSFVFLGCLIVLLIVYFSFSGPVTTKEQAMKIANNYLMENRHNLYLLRDDFVSNITETAFYWIISFSRINQNFETQNEPSIVAGEFGFKIKINKVNKNSVKFLFTQ